MNSDWHKVIVNVSTTIQETIKVIDKAALRIALVVDKEGKLAGVVTDGDVRRGLIKHVLLSEKVLHIMNSDPLVAHPSYTRDQLVLMMESKGVLSIPLVENGFLVGLEAYQQAAVMSKRDNPIFLMAGGFGTRLKPLTDNCPKPLLKVGGKPILERILESFAFAGFHNFYISTHYKSGMIREYFGDGAKWGVNITYVHEENALGTGGALGLLPENLPDLPLIMINGDVITNVNIKALLDYHNKIKSEATMCVRKYEYQVPFGVLECDGHRVVGMVEKPTNSFFVNAGIYVINKNIIGRVAKNERIDMPSFLEQQMANNVEVSMFPLYEDWLDVGRPEDFKKANVEANALRHVESIKNK